MLVKKAHSSGIAIVLIVGTTATTAVASSTEAVRVALAFAVTVSGHST